MLFDRSWWLFKGSGILSIYFFIILLVMNFTIKRFGLHLIFWLSYLLLVIYLEFALAGSSFKDFPLHQRVLIASAVEFFLLPAKLLAVYVMLYGVMPMYLRGLSSWKILVTALLTLSIATVINQASLSYAIFPLIYQEAAPSSIFSITRFVWMALEVVTVVGFASVFKLLKIRLQSIKREKQLVEEKLRSELLFLRAQLNPHFLFNTLNNVYALARKKSDQTEVAILQLSKLLRFMIYECGKSAVPIAAELKVIQDYIELEKLRYNQRLQVTFQHFIDDEGQLVAPLLLFPFVENAFKHCVSETRNDTFVIIQLELSAKQLHFQVRNSKDDSATPSANGIGLANVQRQLELVYDQQYSLEIRDDANEFGIDLKLDLSEWNKH